jgi:hypothetical protein
VFLPQILYGYIIPRLYPYNVKVVTPLNTFVQWQAWMSENIVNVDRSIIIYGADRHQISMSGIVDGTLMFKHQEDAMMFRMRFLD